MSSAQKDAIIWIVVMLSVLTYCKYALKYSFVDIFKDIFGEFSDLLSRKSSPESINAGVIIGLLSTVFLYVFMNTGTKIVNGAVTGHVSGPDFSELIVLCGTVGVLGVICVYVLKVNR